MQRAYLPGAAPRRAVPRSSGARTEWVRVARVLVPLRRAARCACHVDMPRVLRIVDRRDSHEQNRRKREWALPCDISTGTRPTPAHIGDGTGLNPCPPLHRDWARPCHCTGTALTAATSTPACRRGRRPLVHPPSLRADALTACVACGCAVHAANARIPCPHGLLQRLVFVCTDPVSRKPAATTVLL